MLGKKLRLDLASLSTPLLDRDSDRCDLHDHDCELRRSNLELPVAYIVIRLADDLLLRDCKVVVRVSKLEISDSNQSSTLFVKELYLNHDRLVGSHAHQWRNVGSGPLLVVVLIIQRLFSHLSR